HELLIQRTFCTSFFFQAEDGIRVFHVTGVQTCALPILETREVRFPYTMGGNEVRVNSELVKRNATISNQIWDNTLTYDNSFGKHNVTLLAGASFRDESFEMLQAKGIGFPYNNG